MRAVEADDRLLPDPGSRVIKPMPETETAKTVHLLDLMLEFFADDGHWTRGCYDDRNGGRCLVGALLHLSREHRLPTAPAIALLQDAMPRPGLPLVHFNDTRCGSVGETALRHPRGSPSRPRRCGERAGSRRGEDLAARPDREKTSREAEYRGTGAGRAIRLRTPRRLATARSKETDDLSAIRRKTVKHRGVR